VTHKHELIERIDVGQDCVLVYRFGTQTSLVVTTRDDGDVEVFLSGEQCERIIVALRQSLEVQDETP
jgi:hypothetical protein